MAGELVRTGDGIDILNPATEQAIASAPCASRSHLDDAVSAGRAAFAAWNEAGPAARQAVLARIAQRLAEHLGELCRLLTLEQGKPIAESRAEVLGAAAIFRYYAELPGVELLMEEPRGPNATLLRKPLGVVGAIVPWNAPLTLMATKVAPALLAGNAVIVKPAPSTPLATMRVGELCAGDAPRGILSVLGDDGDLGAAMVDHPAISKICFTGSPATGTLVMTGCARTLKRVTLELGGNDAAIVLPGANPSSVAPRIFAAAFRNNGQLCIAIKRVYVHESLYEEMCAQLAALATSAIVGDGLDETTQLGPVHSRMQFDRILSLIDRSAAEGGIAAGGRPARRPGYFIQPTIVRDIPDSAALVQEEQFGPILPVLSFGEEDEAVRRANDTSFGLGGSVWGPHRDEASRLARRLETGVAWVNKHGAGAPELPFGGAKSSGIGVELGIEGLLEFSQLQVLNVS